MESSKKHLIQSQVTIYNLSFVRRPTRVCQTCLGLLVCLSGNRGIEVQSRNDSLIRLSSVFHTKKINANFAKDRKADSKRERRKDRRKRKMKLIYFDIKGAGEPIRLAAALNGVQYEDVRIKMEDWRNELKPKSKFGQLPMLELDDGTVMAQSGAILRYVGSLGNGNSYAADALQRFKIDEAYDLSLEFGTAWSPCLYMFWSPEKYGFESGYGETDDAKARRTTMRKYFVEHTLKDYAAKFEKLVKENGGFLAGDKPSIADCHLVPRLESLTAGFIDDVPTTCLDPYPELKAYISRFNSTPEIAAYLKK